MSNLACPRCKSENIVRNGNTAYGKARYLCKDCRRHFVKNPAKKKISNEKKELVDDMLLERTSLAGIGRVAKVSSTWLQSYVNSKYKNVEKKVEIIGKGKKRLTIQCDEMWSFIGNKNNKYWIWLAMDADSREIVGLHVGARDVTGALALWESLPGVYRQCAVIYTDYWKPYKSVLPSNRHRPVGKHTGMTNYIERFNNTVRQRVSRLVRNTLSFSKKLENHIGAIWLFVHHHNDLIRKQIITS